MHETTAVVLLIVVLGQILVFTIAGLAMWLAGEFGEPPRWWRWGKRGADGSQAWAAGGGLVTLHHDLPIAPAPDAGCQMPDAGAGMPDATGRMTERETPR